jgi:hypothetical protein
VGAERERVAGFGYLADGCGPKAQQ